MRDLFADLRFAGRLLAKNPGFTLAAVVALGFSIGLSTAIFNAFSAMLLRPFPQIRDEERVVFLNSQQLRQPDSIYELSLPDFLDIRAQSKTLEGLTTHVSRTMIFTGGERPERVLGASISVEGFAMLGAQPVRGRLFRPEEGEAKNAQVALLSYALWQRRYGGKDNVIGRVETVNGAPVTIIGVMPAGFTFPDRHEMWMPMVYDPKPEERASHGHDAWARLRPGVTLDEAQAELSALAGQLAREHKLSNEGKGFVVRSLRERNTEDVAVLMRLMLGATIVVLLIACANVANLLLARAAARAHEIAIRVSVGATRGRIVRQVLTESLVLGLLGGAAGLLVAVWTDSLLMAAIPADEIPFWMTFGFDWRVFAFAAVAAVASSLLFGLFPALQVSRSTAMELREGARSSTGGRPARLMRQALVVGQVALSAVLLIGAGLFVRSFLKLRDAPPGYDPEGVITFRVGLPPTQFKDREVINRFFDRLTVRLGEMPGVEAVGAVSMLPGNGNNNNVFIVEGRPVPKSIQEADLATHRNISAGYLRAMRIPVLRGRGFGPDDVRGRPRVILIDQAFADRWFPGEDPIGRRLSFDLRADQPREWHTIVGIIGNVPQQLDRPYERGGYYQPFEQAEANFINYAVRVSGDPATYGPALQRAVSDVMPDIPIYNVFTMSYLHRLAYWERRFFGQVFGAFGLGALFLASLGVYGVMAYSVTQRTPEIGVRMALGATEGDVLRLVGRQGLWLVGLGLGLGLVSALGVSRFMGSLLYAISPTDPPTYFFFTLVLGFVGLLACWLPARRATRVNPIEALRTE
jgi:putative ABC transport system permease protein